MTSEGTAQGAAEARLLLQTGTQREALALCDALLFCRLHLALEDHSAGQVRLRQVEPIGNQVSLWVCVLSFKVKGSAKEGSGFCLCLLLSITLWSVQKNRTILNLKIQSSSPPRMSSLSRESSTPHAWSTMTNIGELCLRPAERGQACRGWLGSQVPSESNPEQVGDLCLGKAKTQKQQQERKSHGCPGDYI